MSKWRHAIRPECRTYPKRSLYGHQAQSPCPQESRSPHRLRRRADDQPVPLVRRPGRGGRAPVRVDIQEGEDQRRHPLSRGRAGSPRPRARVRDDGRVRAERRALHGAQRRPAVQVQRSRVAPGVVPHPGGDRLLLGKAGRRRRPARAPVRLAQGQVRTLVAGRPDGHGEDAGRPEVEVHRARLRGDDADEEARHRGAEGGGEGVIVDFSHRHSTTGQEPLFSTMTEEITMRFLSMIRIDEKSGQQPSERLMNEMGKLIEEMSKEGTLVTTAGLRPTKEGVRLRWRRGDLSVTDGPFTESKEVIGGYALLEAKSEADAVQRTKRVLSIHGERWDLACEVRPPHGPG